MAIPESAGELASKLPEVAQRAFGPVLYVADGPGSSLDVVARGVRESGRRYPVIACFRDRHAPPTDHAIHLGGPPAEEIRGLPLRFGAAVICAGSTPEDVEEELAAVSGRLLAGASVLVLDAFVDGAEEATFGYGELELRERVGTAALLTQATKHHRREVKPNRRRDHERHRSRMAQLERRRLQRELDDAHRQARASQERMAQVLEEFETLGARLAQSEGMQAELAEELSGRLLEGLESLGARLTRSEAIQAGLAEELSRAVARRREPTVEDLDDGTAPASQALTVRLLEELETLGARLTQSEAVMFGLAGELARARGRPQATGVEPPVTVVIAIHNAYEELARCIDSVLAGTPEPHEVLLVDDASTDARVAPLLERYAESSSRVTLLTNSENRGYTATINRGCDWAKGDVVLLNSDTEVASGWLDGLRAVARSRRDVATVTPVSNAAGAFSVPESNTDSQLPEGVSVGEMAALVTRLSPRRRPLTPTSNGFCMYIRREALDRVGAFDEETFPRGYGEENDFSQRAEAAGFVNLIDDATFVYHKRSASFGTHKEELVAAAKERLRARHPDYPRAVKQFLADDPLRELRRAIAGAVRRGPAEIRRLPRSRPTLLLVLHAGGGGTPETNRDLARSLSGSFRCLTLSCDLEHWILTQTEEGEETQLERFDFQERWKLREPLGQERAGVFRALMEDQRVALVHLRSFIATGPELVGLAKGLGAPLVCSLHDFYTVCPTIQLLDEREGYCAGHCTPGPGPCPTSKQWVGPQPDLKHDYVHRWRARMGEHMQSADAFVTTSQAAKDVLVDHFGFMDDGRLQIIEHGRDAAGFRAVSVPPGERPRVVAFGALGISKGTTLLEALLRIDERDGPAFEFHFVGPRHSSFSPEALGGVVHDAYGRDDLPDRLSDIRPSFALVTSIWPETYCHTLTEAWMADLPVFASDIGTLRERITRHGGGWLLDHTDPAAFYAGMRDVGKSAAEWHLRRAEIARIPPRTVDDMAAEYRSLYRELLPRRLATTPELIP